MAWRRPGTNPLSEQMVVNASINHLIAIAANI